MDAYDKAVEYLTDNPNRIHQAWVDGYLGGPEDDGMEACPGNILFGAVDKDRHSCRDCLTILKRNGTDFTDIDLDQFKSNIIDEILNDVTIPNYQGGVNESNLPRFAYWQRRLDEELGRTPPEWIEPKAEEPDDGEEEDDSPPDED